MIIDPAVSHIVIILDLKHASPSKFLQAECTEDHMLTQTCDRL